MDGHQVSRLEQRISQAIEEVLKAGEPVISVESRTAHLMAKAAVAVLEAAQEKDRPAEAPR